MKEHVRRGSYCTLSDFPQRAPIGEQAIGTGWWELDQIFKLYLGQFVVCTGIAGHGKSTFLLNLIANLHRSHGVHSFLYVPENENYIVDKLRKIWGEGKGFEWFTQSTYIQSSAVVGEPPKTLDWILDQAAIAIHQEKVELVLIDPWNELERAKPKDMLMTDHIGECLMLIKQFCRTFNVILIMVAHPTKAPFAGGAREPTLADIEGSMNWFNKCDNGLIVVRKGEEQTTKVFSAKVREIGAGKVGACYFNVDAQTGLFTPIYGGVSP